MSKEAIEDRQDMAVLNQIRSELFKMANSYAGDDYGHIAVALHRVCNGIQDACDRIDALEAESKELASANTEKIKEMESLAKDVFRLSTENSQQQAEIERVTKLLHQYRICKTCGKQLSQAEWDSVHTCHDEKALQGEPK